MIDENDKAMWTKFLEEEVLDKMVEDGIFRVVGINEKGRKIYVLTEVGENPHRILKPPKTMQ